MLASGFVIFDLVRHSSFVLGHSFIHEQQDGQPPAAIRTRSRARTDRRDDDRYRLDDRVGHLYYLSGIVAAERRARLAAACMGYCQFAHHHRRVVLLGACDHDAARRRRLCFSA